MGGWGNTLVGKLEGAPCPYHNKTALLDEWARRAAQTHGDLIVLRGRCNAHAGAGDPYLPFREMLQTLAGDVEGKRAGGTLPPDQARRMWETLPIVGAALVEHGPDLIDSLIPGEALLRRAEAFPSPLLGHAGALAPSRAWQTRLRELVRRSQERVSVGGFEIHPHAGRQGGLPALAPQPDLFAQVTQVLHAVSLGSPLLLVIDDLHWADAGTAALLFHLGRRLAGSRILLACAYRPAALPPAEQSQIAASDISTIIQELIRQWGDVLVDLDRTDGRAFVEAYVDSEPNRLDAAFREALYDHTGGSPLFTAELLASLQREGALVQDQSGQWIEAAGLDWDHWPAQVEQVIAGHVAALPAEDRALLQAASVQGNRFAAEIVARVLACGEETVIRRLSGPLRTRHRLVSAVSLDRLATSGQRLSYYRFRHWLVQRSVYRSLDAVERARLHEATGRALEAIHAPSVPPALAPELARHLEAAGMPLDAARYRLQAGQWATRLVAYDEAIGHLERGLALLGDLPPSGERLSLELALCLALIVPASTQGGWQVPAFRSSLERLADLTQHPDLRDDPQRLDALTVLATGAAWSADPERGRRVGEQLLDLVQDLPGEDRQALMLAHSVLGQSDGLRGRLVDACEHLGQALTLYSAKEDRGLALLFPGGPEVTGWTVLGLALWLLGYADQGRAALQQAVACAQEIGQPSSLAFAHLMAAWTHLFLGNDQATVRGHAQALRSLDKAGSVYGAWARLLAGAEPGPASGQATGADPVLQAAVSGAGQAGQLLLEAQGLVRAGQAERAMVTLDQARTWIERTGMRMLEAEVWRVRGEAWLLPDAGAQTAAPGDGAEACFQRALEVTRGQQARWFELRAAVSLARLWQSWGRRADAHDLLATVYAWFTEGFDTVDLLKARDLLERLA